MDVEIDQLRRRCAADERVIPLSGGLPAEPTFPLRELSRAFERALATHGGEALQYGWPEGRLGVRRFVASWLRRRGALVSPDDVIVTSGAQQAIAIALQVLRRDGDAVLVDAATYPGALDLLRLAGMRPEPSREARARIAYAMPAIGNPRGAGLSMRERVSLVARAGAIVEDDAYADLRFDGDAPAPLLASQPGVVWHVGTFSKTLCPGLRVGWLIPPLHFRERALAAKHASDLQANTVAQAMLESFLETCDFEARLVELRAFYAARAERLVEALRSHLPEARFERPEGGFSIWVELDEEGDERELLRYAIARGTSFDPGGEFRASSSGAPMALRLAFSSVSLGRIDDGVRRLARALRDYRSQR